MTGASSSSYPELAHFPAGTSVSASVTDVELHVPMGKPVPITEDVPVGLPAYEDVKGDL